MYKILKDLFVVTAFATSSVSAYGTEVYKFKLASSWTPSLTQFTKSIETFAKSVEEMSNGRLLIEIHDANKTKAALGVFDLVKTGQYDMGHTSAFFYKGKDPNLAVFTTQPFGMTALEQYGWYYYDQGLKFLQEAFKPHRIIAFPGGNTGMQMGGWFKKEINSLEDIKGLKIRIPGYGGEVFAKQGAIVTNIPGGEVYTALERGTIDAVEWVGPAMDFDLGFQKVAKFYYTGWQEPAGETHYFVNERAFGKLPKDLQEILKVAMKNASYNLWVENQFLNGVLLAKIKKDYPDVQFRDFSQEVFDAFKSSYSEIAANLAKQTPLLGKVLESQDNYLSIVRPWTNLSDYKYLQNAQSVK